MRKSDLIVEFQKRFELPDIKWNKFLSEIEEGVPLKDICEEYNINYNATRYLFYSLSMDISSKAKRKNSILELHKDIAKEGGEKYDLVEALEKELEVVTDKNRKLNKSLTVTRDENNSLRALCRKVDRVENLEERLLEEFSAKIAGIEFDLPPLNLIVPKGVEKKRMAFALISDVHFNEIVNPTRIEGYNEFNNKICIEGLDKVFQEVHKFNASILKVYLAGDLVSGILHGLDTKGELPVTESVVQLAKYLANRLNSISDLYDSIEVVMVNGNHSRLYPKPVSDFKAFDLEHLLYEIMKSLIVKDNIKTNYSKSGYAIDNVGTIEKPAYVGIHHLDNKKLNPLSSADVLKQFEMFDEIFGVRTLSLLGGHTHKPIFSVNNRGGNVLINGCVSGSNEYGFTNDFLPLKPYQWVGVWNEKGYIEEQKCVRIRE
jgi:hypothetical protein